MPYLLPMKLYPHSIYDKLGYQQILQAVLELAQSVHTEELLREMRPSANAEEVQQQLQQTREMLEILYAPEPFPLQEFPDIRHYLKSARAEGSIIPLQGLSEILIICTAARQVGKFFKTHVEVYPQLHALASAFLPMKELEAHLKSKIAENGELRDDASPELRAIRRKLHSRKNELRKTVNRVLKNAIKDHISPDESATIRNGRLVIPVQATFKNKIEGFIHDVSATGQTVYLEPVEALQLNNEIRQYEAEEKREIERILLELTNHVRQQAQALHKNSATLAQIDAISAKAKLTKKLNGDVPIVSDSLRLNLKQALNPVLMLRNLRINQKKERETIIPLNLLLEEEEQCLIISGPNAGGKSVAIKTVGLMAMMLQSGFGVPADPTSEFPVFPALFVDMGDDQSIENDLSTFSSRLQWMRETLGQFRNGSLILIDEAAAGTDPEEGGALFQAFIEKLLEHNCKVLVTTHHGSLKVFANAHPKATNGSMEFNRESLSPVYRFKKGVPGSSYAFEIAQRMQLNKDVLGRARTLLGEAKNKMETLILELEETSQQASQLKEKYSLLQAKADAERKRYEEKIAGIESEKQKIRENALTEAKTIMDSANRRVEEAVQRIAEKSSADKVEIKQIRKDLEQEKSAINTELNKLERQKQKREKRKNDPPKPGDYVRFKDGDTSGELIEVKGGNAVVRAGALRFKTKYKNLVKAARPGRKPKTKARSSIIVGESSLTAETVKPTLDVRGKRADEALNEVTHYIDRAIFRGMNRVEILHGKGDGILREQIQANLQKRADVKNVETAPADQGGAGVTLVQLS